MINALFDTLKFAQKLKIGGFSEHQAVNLTEAHNEAFMETIENAIATKTDIVNLRYEFKMDIADLKHELKADIADIKSHLKVHNWMIGFMLTGMATLLVKSFFG